MTHCTESEVEDAAVAWLSALGYTVLHGPEIAWGMPAAERSDPNSRNVLCNCRAYPHFEITLGRIRPLTSPPAPLLAGEGSYSPSLTGKGRGLGPLLGDRRVQGEP
jgi:hypothetical protein